MAQTQTIGKVHTRIYNLEGYKCVQYHITDVVKFNEAEIILNTGGWFTSTTKNRMNQTSNQFNLGFKVYQEKGQWYVEHKINGMVLTFKFIGEVMLLSRLSR